MAGSVPEVSDLASLDAYNLSTSWDEDKIQTRSEELFKVAIKVWPRPQEDFKSGS